MKTISKLKDLEQYGICTLTGEADALGYRTLCGLTEAGRDLVAEAYGLKPDGFQDGWNDGVASCMLDRDAWRQIGPIALLTECHTVLLDDRGYFGLQEGETYTPAWQQEDGMAATFTRDGETMPWPYGEIQRVFSYGSHPRSGSRNVHVMRGRAT